jgi:sugar transferase (PEP-CTERM system associated)
VGEPIVNPAIIGTIDELVQIVERERIHRVVISLPDRRGRLPVRELLKLRLRGVHVEDAHTLYEHVAGRISLDSVHPSWLVFSDGFQKLRWQLFLKRCFDIVLASAGLLLSFPLIVLSAICIKLDSKGPILFRQERVGQFGGAFELFKFRSMVEDAESEGKPRWASANDSRVTRVGRLLRRSRLDELPQFFNVLKGDMSFVGPRPERPYFVARLEEKLKYYPDRHVVKPGLTGWAQINFRYASSEEETREKLEYDFFYIKNFSILFDLVIIFRTIKIVLLGEGAR